MNINKLLPRTFELKLVLLASLLVCITFGYASNEPSEEKIASQEKTDEYQQLPTENYEYCIVGAGAGGLQMGYYFHYHNHHQHQQQQQQQQSDPDSTDTPNYVILEKHAHAAAFFTKFPQGRRLISINKRYTGVDEQHEFAWRHDWNSLLSHDPKLRFTKYSEMYYAPADDLVRYLKDFAENLHLNVHYHTSVTRIDRESSTHPFQIDTIVSSSPLSSSNHSSSSNDDNNHQQQRQQQPKTKTYICKRVILGTGFIKPRIPRLAGGNELLEFYHYMNANPKNYTGQKILLLGKGNSAFEVADLMINEASTIHILGRNLVRLSYRTHYVGDVRAINSKFLDHYQLKSLDGLIESAYDELYLKRDENNGRIRVYFVNPPANASNNAPTHNHNIPFDLSDVGYRSYDRVIACNGFLPDLSFFSARVKPNMTYEGKYLTVNADFESINVPDLYVVGTLMHVRDFRKSSGGFIHGFRYLIRSLYHVLQVKYHQQTYPSSLLEPSVNNLTSTIVERVNSVASMYQMFGQMGDVFILPNANLCDRASGLCDRAFIRYIPDVLLDKLGSVVQHFINDDHSLETSKQASNALLKHRILVLTLEYGPNFYGEKVLSTDRAVSEVEKAHLSRFLHPVLREYHPSHISFQPGRPQGAPFSEHHVLEDFLTKWSDLEQHIKPLKRYIRQVLKGKKVDPPVEDDQYFVAPIENKAALQQIIEMQGKLSSMYTNLGQGKLAQKALQNQLEAKIQYYGANHPYVAHTMKQLAIMMMQQSSPSQQDSYVEDKIISLLKNALGILSKHLQPNHHEIKYIQDALHSFNY